MQCPACAGAMNVNTYEGVEIDLCTICGGVWLDDKEIQTIINTVEEQFDEDQRIKAVMTKDSDKKKEKTPQCPKCRANLQTIEYAYDSGVHVDRCPRGHGIYLDQGELEKVQVLVEAFRPAEVNAAIAENPDGAKLCPRDKTLMKEKTYESEVIDECPQCGGIWCDGSEFRSIVKTREVRFAPQDFPNIVAEHDNAKTVSNLDAQGALPCAICNQPMKRLNFSYNSGIIIDRCIQGHGVWLDAQELEQSQVFDERWTDKVAADKAHYIGAVKQAGALAEQRYEEAVRAGREKGASSSLFGRLAQVIKNIGD